MMHTWEFEYCYGSMLDPQHDSNQCKAPDIERAAEEAQRFFGVDRDDVFIYSIKVVDND